MIHPWKVIKSEVTAQTSIFKLKTLTAHSPTNHQQFHDFFVLEAGDWVNVIPVTSDGRVVLVRQYRYGNGEVTLEIPGGLIDPGQTPLESAQRELLEETGYGNGEWTLLGSTRPNPAFLNNWCHCYLALNVEKMSEQNLDEVEEIEVVTVDLKDIPQIIANGDIDHSLVLAAFFYYQLNHRFDG
jgi:ADP-ribose pyrophosphatase